MFPGARTVSKITACEKNSSNSDCLLDEEKTEPERGEKGDESALRIWNRE